MFNYIHEAIVNDAAQILEKDGDLIVVKRVGNFDVKKIKKDADGKGVVYVTEPIAGTKATITLPNPADIEGDVLRLLITITTPTKEIAEFASPCWQEFGKPIVIEVGSECDMEKFTGLVLEATSGMLKLQDGKTLNDGLLEAVESWMHIDCVGQDVTFPTCEDCNPSKEGIKEVEVTVTEEEAEFGTYKWLTENLRFPTYGNLRYVETGAENRPVAGATYKQYAFSILSEKAAPGGLSGVNQVVASETPVVIYAQVESGAAAKLEGQFGTATAETHEGSKAGEKMILIG